jgi:hypothetical protein
VFKAGKKGKVEKESYKICTACSFKNYLLKQGKKNHRNMKKELLLNGT